MKTLRSVVAIVALGLVTAAIFVGSETTEEVAPLLHPAKGEGTVASSASSEIAIGSATEVANRTSPPAVPSDWRSAMTAENAYLAVVQLREQRQKGSFAIAREVLSICTRFWVTEDINANPGANDVNAPTYSARQGAKTALQTRCSQLHDASALKLQIPLNDDPNGIKYDTAFRYSTYFESNLKSAKTAEMVQEFVAQGRPELLLTNVRIARSDLRKQLDVSNNELITAIELVQMRLTSTPDMAQSDLRLVFNCYRFGLCQYNYGEMPPEFSEDERARVLGAAAKIEAAMRGGDIAKSVFGF